MFIEDKIIQENILSKENIDELYHLFVNLCDSNRYSINPLNFINVFQNISEKRGVTVDKDIWNQIFFQIDNDKDGTISFQDFLRFVYFNLKIIFGKADERLNLQKIK